MKLDVFIRRIENLSEEKREERLGEMRKGRRERIEKGSRERIEKKRKRKKIVEMTI